MTAAPTPTKATESRRIAAIDIGSNSIRQIVADVSPDGGIQVVDEMKAAPRLAMGLVESGLLDEDAMSRAVEAIARMATLARQLGAERVEAVATSAVRDAANGDAFVQRVERDTGLRIRVLDGEAEARLSFRSALAHFDLGSGRAVVADIGGGSLELVLSVDGVIERIASLPLGAVRLTERFLSDGSTRPKLLRALRREVRAQLRPHLPVRDWRGAPLIGSGGTFTNLAGLYLTRQGIFTARSVHAAKIPRGDVEHLLELLHSMTPVERRELEGLNADRADIIVAGLAVVAEVMARLEARDVQVSRYGIREGILLEAARVRPVIADPGEARERSVRELAERSHYEAPHAANVQRLALRLFDSLGGKLGAVPAERALLADAALLHDVGYHISYDRHHKHSYHLIVHAELLGVQPADQIVIANVARYHRGAPPRKKHRNYGALDRELRRCVRRLSAILRVADGFDRGHTGAVKNVRVRWLQRALRISPEASDPRASLRLECWGAHRKSALLAKLAGVPVEIVAPDGSVLSSDDTDSNAE
ncbi:MAG TPA: Ppx/GppA phosphatase family protein [Gemmatimonadaceae bacterium]|nr:Ppx/GppA phosphatase family protein [Gemmatimonadaceae bacterium]